MGLGSGAMVIRYLTNTPIPVQNVIATKNLTSRHLFMSRKVTANRCTLRCVPLRSQPWRQVGMAIQP